MSTVAHGSTRTFYRSELGGGARGDLNLRKCSLQDLPMIQFFYIIRTSIIRAP